MTDINDQELEELMIYRSIVGSRAYGTARANSDTDINSIFIRPYRYFMGMQNVQKIRNSGQSNDVDEDYFTLKYFLNQAMNGSYRFVEMLFVDNNDILYESDYGKRLRNTRELFITKSLLKSYLGHAKSIEKKIENNHDVSQESKKRYNQVRCLYMAHDIVHKGKIRVRQPDARIGNMIKIRDSIYKESHIEDLINKLEEEIKDKKESTDLPETANGKKINNFYSEIVEDHLSTYFRVRGV